MIITAKVAWLKKAQEEVVTYPEVTKAIGWSKDTEYIEIDLYEYHELEKFEEWLQSLYDSAHFVKNRETTAKRTMAGITSFRNTINATVSEIAESVLDELESVPSILKAFLMTTEHQWLFKEVDGFMLPYYVSNIRYTPDKFTANERGKKLLDVPACVTVELTYRYRRATSVANFCVVRSDIYQGMTLKGLLSSLGYYVENRLMFDEYTKVHEVFLERSEQTGMQYMAHGVAKIISGSWYSERRTISMVNDGAPTRVIIDDETVESEEQAKRNDFLDASTYLYYGNDREKGPLRIPVPVHPYIKVFELKRHQHVLVHVDDIIPYEYDKTAFEKLILPPRIKNLVSVLVEGTNHLMEDIVQGKTGGVIVMSTGDPGVGKTLTAEIYSEFAERPLYSVQSSQLGLDIVKIEQNLAAVLQRAMRWKAILLIDEADVFVRSRGESIHQNAIVGVFLRILEYYRGILFMTSNRGTIIDDAIMSRCTAHIKYARPSHTDLRAIWQVLSDQFKLPISEQTIDQVVADWPTITGRDVKGLLKLASFTMLANKETEITLETLRNVGEFKLEPQEP